MQFYFAHNFNNRHEFRKIELEFESSTGVSLLNPFYDDNDRIEEMQRLDSHGLDDRERISEIEDFSQAECEDIVNRDLAHLAECDGLLTIIEKPSIGTTIELVNAKTMAKPVSVVSPRYKSHPWIRVYADETFDTIEEFKEFLLDK